MQLKSFDFLSSKITLYSNKCPRHKNNYSAVLSLLSFIICLLAGIYFAYELFKRSNPKVNTYEKFEEDIGEYSLLNEVSHFITLGYSEKVDFKAVRIIAISISMNAYLTNYKDEKNNLNELEHWEYLQCDEDDLIYFKDANVDKETFFRSACLKRYWSVKDQKFYGLKDKEFPEPKIMHGTSNKNMNYYSIVVKHCDSMSNNTCYEDAKKMDDYVYKQEMIAVNVVDHYLDPINFDSPFNSYIQSLTSALNSKTFVLSNAHFSPKEIVTDSGYLINEKQTSKKYSYSQVPKQNMDSQGSGVSSVLSFRFTNNIQITERSYKKIPETLANIGGIIQAIRALAKVLNYILDYFAIYLNTVKILFTSEKKQKSKKIITNLNKETTMKNNYTLPPAEVNTAYNNFNKLCKENEIKGNKPAYIGKKSNSNQPLKLNKNKQRYSEEINIDNIEPNSDNSYNNILNNLFEFDNTRLKKIKQQPMNFTQFCFNFINYYVFGKCCKINKNTSGNEILRFRKEVLSEEFMYYLFFLVHGKDSILQT